MSINEGMNSGIEMMNNAISNLQENNLIYIGLFVVILLCILTIYFLYNMIGKFLFLKEGKTVYKTTVPVLCNKASTLEANFAKVGNGNRRSYSFWLYIYDISKNYTKYKTVAAVSDIDDYANKNSTTYLNASPHIFLDQTNNSMYCHFFNKDNLSSMPASFNNVTLGNIDDYMKSGIKIDYIPLQRWVHVAFVVNADSFSTSIYAYVDADLVKTVRNNVDGKKLNNINLDRTKYLLVGGENSNTNNGPGFSGLISNFSSYNYDLNQSDIVNIYKQGPVNGFLQYLGIGMYGVRNPIYKL